MESLIFYNNPWNLHLTFLNGTILAKFKVSQGRRCGKRPSGVLKHGGPLENHPLKIVVAYQMNMIYIKKNDKHGSFELGKSSNRLRNWPASHVWLPEGICCTLLCCVFFESWEATCQKSEAIWLSLKIGYPNISFIYIYIYNMSYIDICYIYAWS